MKSTWSNIVALVLATLMTSVTSQERCNKVETVEAEKAFKNCVESAQASILNMVVSSQTEETGFDSDICSSLTSMLAVCKQQTTRLAKCKGHEHAEKVKNLHLSATADIIRSMNRQDLRVEACSVFTPKKAVPVAKAMEDQKSNLEYDYDNVEYPTSTATPLLKSSQHLLALLTLSSIVLYFR